jgi:DNA-binding response OmpR family regulator
VGEILLIAAEWRFRALVRAQLLEEGYTVKALPSLESALAYLLCSDERPRLTVLDAQGIDIQSWALADLWRLSGQAALLLCGGALNRAGLDGDGLPPAELLLRPFRVRDVVEKIGMVLSWSEDETTTE